MLQKIERILKEFRKLDPEMPMQTALTLVSVAQLQNKHNGISIKELAEILGISGAAASRNVSKLTKFGAKQKAGLNLLESFEDPMFRVRKCVKITPHGQRIIDSLQEILNDHQR